MFLKYNLCFIKYKLYLYKLKFDFIKYKFNFIKHKLYFKEAYCWPLYIHRVFLKIYPLLFISFKKNCYLCIAFSKRTAELAQLVEQRIRNAWVGGSSPPFGSRWLEMRCAMYDYIVHRILLWGDKL